MAGVISSRSASNTCLSWARVLRLKVSCDIASDSVLSCSSATFQRCGVRRVLIAFDRDDAGERGTAKLAERLTAAGQECLRIQFPKGTIQPTQ